MKKRPENNATRARASLKSTGGAGFTFADKIGARFLLDIIRGGTPLGADAGQIVGLHFEVREGGWLMDDQLLVLREGEEEARCALSVKSDRRLTPRGLNKQFVSDAWLQWDGVDGASFDRERDFLGLATTPASVAVERDWNAILQAAQGGPAERVARRLLAKGHFSTTKKRLFESVRSQTQSKKRSAVESVKLLSRLRMFPFDFDAPQSEDDDEAIRQCRETATSGTLRDAKKLWRRLEGLAKEGRSTGAHFDLPKLIDSLRGVVELRDYPDFTADWAAIEDRAQANMGEIGIALGDDIHLDRTAERVEVLKALQKGRCVAIVGDSGSGKSAVVVDVIRNGGAFRRVLWLNAQQLTQPSQPDLAQSLGLHHSFESLVGASNIGDSVLVLDAFEQLRGPARSRVSELIQAVIKAGSDQWKILLTVQPYQWSEARQVILDAGMSEPQRVDFPNADPKDIFSKLKSAPGVESLFRRSELRPILRNLATLDWVIRTERKRHFEPTKDWVGEAELIGWIWKQWVGDSADRLARDAVLFHLGEAEGEKISGAVPLSGFSHDDLRLIADLERQGVLRVTESAVKFSHDLIGDWARLRSLIAAGEDAGEQIRRKAGTPRWSRAIRLYAQRLVERDEKLDSWKAFAANLSGDSPEEKLASDLFLDGIIFAANAAPLLERTWTELLANKGEILRRLLQRVMQVATFPDSRFQAEMPAEDADLAAVWFRIPNPLYWMPLLGALAKHAGDLAQEGIFEAAAACELWLRTMPLSFPGRREAATVAVALALEAQGRRAEGVQFIGDAGKTIFQALLYGAPELPEEVSRISLELSGRRDEGESVRLREKRADERRRKEAARTRGAVATHSHPESSPISLTGSWGPMVDAGSDGPKRPVPRGFRTAILDSNALQGLAAVRPAAAREVLLAVCLDDPKQQSEYGRDSFSLPGFAHWLNGAPPTYWKGSFLGFLEVAPEEALEAILRLVNFATNRWLERAISHWPTDEDRALWSVDLVVRGKAACWAGDASVFAWHRAAPNIPAAVVCSLMALEKWLYDMVERGQAIDEWVEKIFQEGSSLAFAGVLVTVGLRYPRLFAGVLQPLLGSSQLYEIQQHLAIQESSGFWKATMMLWAHMGDKFIRVAYEWQEMPHRRVVLQDIATNLMLFNGGTRHFLSERRKVWAKRLESAGEGRQRLEFILAQFDPANYTERALPDGRVQFEYKQPAHLESRSREARAQIEIRMTALQLPELLRQAIAERRGTNEDDLAPLVRQLKQIATLRDAADDPFMKNRKAEAVAGGIAFLILQHRGWLSKNVEAEQWCLTTLRALASREPNQTYSPYDVLDTSQEGFVGQAGICLLRETDSEWVKQAVMAGVAGHYYRSAFHTLNTAFRLRDQLGEEFIRIVNTMLLWAILRRAAERVASATGDGRAVARYRGMILKRYLKGRIPAAPIPLQKANAMGLRLLRRHEWKKPGYWGLGSDREGPKKISRVYPGLDLEVVRQGLGFLLEMTEAAKATERGDVLARGTELLEFELGMIPKIPNHDVDIEVEGTLYEFDTWALERVVDIMLSGISLAEARRLWKPILDLPVAAYEWVREFFAAWFRLGLVSGTDAFQPIWAEMGSYVLDSITWSPSRSFGWFHVHDVVAEMIGIRSASRALGQASRTNLVETTAPLYERWATTWAGHADLASSFAYFLATEAGSILLPMGLRELAKRLESFSDYDWTRDHLKDALSSALRTGWKKYRVQLRSNGELRKAFLAVLNALCARSDEMALAIRLELAREST